MGLSHSAPKHINITLFFIVIIAERDKPFPYKDVQIVLYNHRHRVVHSVLFVDMNANSKSLNFNQFGVGFS